MTNTPVADLVTVRRKIAKIISEDWADFVGVGPSELATADRILAALTPASAEPVAWAEVYGQFTSVSLTKTDHHTVPLYARPAPVTVEAAAKVLMDDQTHATNTNWQSVWDAMREDAKDGDLPMAFYKALRALSGEKS